MKKPGALNRPIVIFRSTKNRTPRAVLGLGEFVLMCMKKHPELFPTMILPLEQFETDVVALRAAEVKATSRKVGLHAVRDTRFRKVVAELDLARAYVQWQVDCDPENAAVIVGKAGIALKGMPLPSAFGLKLLKSARSHCFRVKAPVTYTRQTHQWQTSLDGRKTWNDEEQSAQATKTFGPYPPGTIVAVRHRSFDSKHLMSDWGVAIDVVVT